MTASAETLLMNTDVSPLLHLDYWPEHFTEAGPPSPDELFHATCCVGRNNGPELLYLLDLRGLPTIETATAAVAHVRSQAEWPLQQLPRKIWRHLFDLAGYTANGEPAERPRQALELFRGTVPAWRTGWSWTSDLETARWFARRNHWFGTPLDTCVVYRAEVAPWRLLACATGRGDDGDSEHEYVVYTHGLRIRGLESCNEGPSRVSGHDTSSMRKETG